MRTTIDAETKTAAAELCLQDCGWYPDTVIEVDSGNEDTRAWMCFETAAEAELWSRQR